MKSPYYLAAAVVFALLVAVLLFLVLVALHKGFNLLGYTPEKRRRLVVFTGVGLVTWLCYCAALSVSGILHQFSVLPPRFLLLLLPPLFFLTWMANSAQIGKLLQVLPGSWLIAFQSMRVVVELVLWAVFAAGVIPVQMTFEGLNFDVISGLLALPVAYLVFVRKSLPVSAAIAYNVLGLGLVLTILAISILSAPLPFRLFTDGPANTFVAYLPFVWLPGFVVPLALTGHVLSLRQILRHKRAEKGREQKLAFAASRV